MKQPQELHINKGIELLLRRKTKSKESKTFEINFGKMVSVFKRKITIYFEFSFDIKK
jgi:hypothetical protein